ncbi:hypothetical protein EXN66_Car016502 [Channa argus]|uniref:Uncharacterized protein n=1 Tax=Channa argus TaxID=215402 RepID=A0A6G1QEG5_CHAAH|nr:hypothetical protein EXN66_Car016502 [Channa argus]
MRILGQSFKSQSYTLECLDLSTYFSASSHCLTHDIHLTLQVNNITTLLTQNTHTGFIH